MSKITCLALAATLIGALAAACGGTDSATFPNVTCCVGNAHYVCPTPISAVNCQKALPDTTGCMLQTTACPK